MNGLLAGDRNSWSYAESLSSVSNQQEKLSRTMMKLVGEAKLKDSLKSF